MNKKDKILTRAITQNGTIFQSVIAMEECAELSQAISKYIREPEAKGARNHLVEEMADIMICLDQLKKMYQVTDEELNHWTESKLNRLEERLKTTL